MGKRKNEKGRKGGDNRRSFFSRISTVATAYRYLVRYEKHTQQVPKATIRSFRSPTKYMRGAHFTLPRFIVISDFGPSKHNYPKITITLCKLMHTHLHIRHT